MNFIMTQLILKNQIEQQKLDILLFLLKTWNIDVEVKAQPVNSDEEYIPFSESFGMWKDRDIDAKELRRQASGIKR
jgi:hypothetical protein